MSTSKKNYQAKFIGPQNNKKELKFQNNSKMTCSKELSDTKLIEKPKKKMKMVQNQLQDYTKIANKAFENYKLHKD